MRFNITDAVKHLIIINVVMFIGTITLGNGHLFDTLFTMYFPTNDLFKPWQVITHMFMHGGPAHIFFNMFALWMFGTPVEQRLGTKKFLFIYFSAGFGALLFQLGYYYYDYFSAMQVVSELGMNSELLHKIMNIDALDGEYIRGEILHQKMIPFLNEYNFTNNINDNQFKALFDLNIVNRSAMVGASGCIMGILAAFGMMNPNAKLMLIFLPIPIKAKYFIPGLILLDIISALTGQSFFSPSNTAYMAHVGGAVIGFIIMYFWKKNDMNKYRWN
ncbi:rhomboid family intramembrane serine protease [Winogradskyella sp. SYSU M77433]|uniref:rhomboid family intramembrane serine protease n=1 Tax=Winogradskyella sp. SYSU M77433 TaxID=3042722 RepID=UPI0024807E2B|nr:rhomboid family intramembrane serine protease [Winogradskyella sp. SYSU M77433]MDH7912954.1 rhomboid family intramembrane serine protease [Winogradskyella sp. SYSU M77433]